MIEREPKLTYERITQEQRLRVEKALALTQSRFRNKAKLTRKNRLEALDLATEEFASIKQPALYAVRYTLSKKRILVAGYPAHIRYIRHEIIIEGIKSGSDLPGLIEQHLAEEQLGVTLNLNSDSGKRAHLGLDLRKDPIDCVSDLAHGVNTHGANGRPVPVSHEEKVDMVLGIILGASRAI